MRVKLGEVCTKITDGSHNPPQGIETSPFIMLSSKNIEDDSISLSEPRFLSKEDYEKENLRTNTTSNDILMTIVGTVGRTAVVPQNLNGICLQRSVAVIKPKLDIIDSRYLMYLLQSMRSYFEKEAHGVAQKGLYLKQLSDIQIDLIDISLQRNIVTVLDKLSNLIAMRKKQLQKLDVLVKSRFIELFGDPEQNPRGLPILPWNKVFLTTTGKLDSNAMVENGQYPFFTCAKESFWIDTYAFDCEALLLAGNNAAGVYDVKHYKGKFNAYQRTYVLRLINDQWSYKLFKRQLEDKLRYLQSQSKGTNTRYLTLGILNELRFIVPPVAEQEQFAAFVEQTDKSKLTIQQSLDKLELMKKALMQEYFG